MAEHNGGNRSGKDRGSYGGGRPSVAARSGHQTIQAAIPADSVPRSRDRPSREGGANAQLGAGDRDRKPFGDRPSREGDGERRSFGAGDRDRKPFGDRPSREGRASVAASVPVIVTASLLVTAVPRG